MAKHEDVITQTDEELVEWANSIEDGLDDYEVNFVDDMNKWLKDRGPLTEKQRSFLERIVEKKG